MKAWISSLAIAVLLSTLVPAPSFAQVDWVPKVFAERQHDFGTVARGSKLRHSFPVANRTDREIRILSYRPKCGCTDVRLGAKVIPPGTQTTIEATLDTTKFDGAKSSGLTLQVEGPTTTEFDLGLTCFIRSDITITPGGADFGNVGRSGKPTVTLNLDYRGAQANWDVREMDTLSDSVIARLEKNGTPGGPRSYRLTVTLDPAKIDGPFRDEITLYTTDPNTPKIPIAVTARVLPIVNASPAVRYLGTVKAGQTVKWTVLVRADRAFRIEGLDAEAGSITAAPDGSEAKALHTLQISYTAPTTTGPDHATLLVRTDVPNEPAAKLTAFATVTP